MNAPIITIYIPTKNRLELLKRSIFSVLSQTYNNWELIIVNDASTDDTFDYLESIKSEKIIVIHQTVSKGACVARNTAINKASGEFITGLDDDDYFEANRLTDFVQAWSVRPQDSILLYTNNKLLIEDKIMGSSNRGSFCKKRDLLIRNRIGNQIFTTTENIKKINGFDEKLLMWQDIDCWYRLLKGGNGFLVNNSSYITDVSDREDRITINNSKKLSTTYKYFCKKNNLKVLEGWLLFAHFTQYNQFKNFPLRRIKLKIARIYYNYIK